MGNFSLLIFQNFQPAIIQKNFKKWGVGCIHKQKIFVWVT